MRKQDRQQAILELVASQAIGRQDELARLLTERGFSVTQASVSRDLDELGVTKIHGHYARQAANGRGGEYGRITLAKAGTNLVVIKCASGLASAAAVRIDAAAIPEIVGTIAGDDTIFAAVGNADEQARAIRILRTTLETSERNGEN